jgi:GDP-mannose 4,6 dehydratase
LGRRESALENLVNPWRGRRVFLTGRTGFKGGWLALWLARQGTLIRGYALDLESKPNLYTAACVGAAVDNMSGDICDSAKLEMAMTEYCPEVVFHLAAQPLVRRSYADPLSTFMTNVMGTAHVLEAVRKTSSVRAVVRVPSDKCYLNREWVWPYREKEALGGHDPYLSSKSCAEIATAVYRNSYFPPDRLRKHRVAVAMARAGNVQQSARRTPMAAATGRGSCHGLDPGLVSRLGKPRICATERKSRLKPMKTDCNQRHRACKEQISRVIAVLRHDSNAENSVQ